MSQSETIEWEEVSDVSEEYTGEAHHIRLNNKVEVLDWNENVKLETADFVISATASLGQSETYAFPADESGEVKSWGEIISAGDGLVSQKNTLDWKKVANQLVNAANGPGLMG